MTGSSNISYAPGTWQMPLVGPEEPVLNESLQTTPGIVEAGQEEVIMVDDVQPESAEKHPSSQPQEYFSAPRCVFESACWDRHAIAPGFSSLTPRFSSRGTFEEQSDTRVGTSVFSC
jgi:hypothetical protein